MFKRTLITIAALAFMVAPTAAAGRGFMDVVRDLTGPTWASTLAGLITQDDSEGLLYGDSSTRTQVRRPKSYPSGGYDCGEKLVPIVWIYEDGTTITGWHLTYTCSY